MNKEVNPNDTREVEEAVTRACGQVIDTIRSGRAFYLLYFGLLVEDLHSGSNGGDVLRVFLDYLQDEGQITINEKSLRLNKKEIARKWLGAE